MIQSTLTKYAFLFAATLTAPCYCYTVENDSEHTHKLSDNGEGALIEEGVIVEVLEGTGFLLTNNKQQVVNDGQIDVSGSLVQGIYNQKNADAQVVNRGKIEVAGNMSNGIYNFESSDTTILNEGKISTSHLSSRAIFSNNSTNARINNSGSLSTSGTAAHGIYTFLDTNPLIINTGDISTSGMRAHGVYDLSSKNLSVTNSGTIATKALNAHAIYSNGTSFSLTNTGNVIASGQNGDAVHSIGSDVVITNAGIIRASDGHALNLKGSNPTLVLLHGSKIEGEIEVSSAPLNLTIDEGMNVRLTINDNSKSFGTLEISSPFVTVGNTETVAVIDDTGLTLQPDVLEDLSDSVLDAIYRRRLSYLFGCFPFRESWIEALGVYRERSDHINYTTWEEGFLAGFNQAICNGYSLGLFGGLTYGEAEVARITQNAEISTILGGGVLERFLPNAFIACAITGGHIGWNNSRVIASNLVPGGEERAKADVSGWMISPEVNYARWLYMSPHFRPLASLTLRYAGLFLGDYREEGSSSNLLVENRHISLLKLKGDLSFTCNYQTDSVCWNLEPYLGAAGRFQLAGKTVNGELLAQPLTFETRTARNLLEGIMGIRGEESIGNWTLFFNGQGMFDSQKSTRIFGEAGLDYTF